MPVTRGVGRVEGCEGVRRLSVCTTVRSSPGGGIRTVVRRGQMSLLEVTQLGPGGRGSRPAPTPDTGARPGRASDWLAAFPFCALHS